MNIIKETVELVTIKYDNGAIAKRYTQKNDKYHGLFQEYWGDSNKKYKECNYVDGVLNGLYQTWHANGKIAEKYTYVNNIREGLYEEWYENGNKTVEFIAVNGSVDGIAISWNEDGTFKQLKYFKNNKEVNHTVNREAHFST